MATTDADGRVDVSPKGDPPGFVHVIDDTTIAIPERPGNKRVDGYLNVLQRPHVGTVFLIPGRGDTLRINGSATIVSDADYFDAMIVEGKRPILALEIAVEEVFFHCAKAFLASDAWKPETWDPTAVPSVAQLAKAIKPDMSDEELEKYYSEDNLSRHPLLAGEQRLRRRTVDGHRVIHAESGESAPCGAASSRSPRVWICRNRQF